MTFADGFVIGSIITFLLHLHAMNSYKRILVMKAEDGSAEKIGHKFYYIEEEGKNK